MKILWIYLAAMLLALFPFKAHAYDYDVDMPPSNDRNFELIRLSVNGCDTFFKVPKKELSSFEEKLGPTITKDMIQKAIVHYTSGCK